MGKHRTNSRTLVLSVALLSCLLLPACRETGEDSLPSQAIFHPGGAQALHPSEIDPASLVVRQRVYIPVYSSIHWERLSFVTELSATVSIRNADAERSLVLLSARYFDSLGQPIEEYIDDVMELDPMSTVEFVVGLADSRGGSGANFLVEWGATGPIAEPVMEAIMLGQSGNAGISFVSVGRPVRVIEPDASTDDQE